MRQQKTLYCSIILILTLLTGAGAQSKKFFHITSKDGLSQNNVYAFCLDHRGFMWIGTRDGLNKYDGYNITVYKYSAGDTNTISNNFIRVVFQDSKNRLWVGTSDGGLNQYNFINDKFSRHILPGNSISNIVEDARGDLWIATADAGLLRFKPDSGTVTSYTYDPYNASSISSSSLRALEIDKEGYLWLGFWGAGGLNRFDPQTAEVVKYSASNSGLSSDYIRDIYIDHHGIVWIGTDGGGLCRFDPGNNSFETFRHQCKKNSISHNVVTAITEGFDGNLWIGTENGGINILDRGRNIFKIYKNNPSDFFSLNNNSVYALYSSPHAVWAGTYTGGVNFTTSTSNIFQYYNSKLYEKNSLSHNSVLCFYEDNEGIIWIGTDGGGLNRFDPRCNSFRAYLYNENDISSISSDYVVSLLEKSESEIWVGTYGGGMNVFNKKTGKFKRYYNPLDPGENSVNKHVWAMDYDTAGNLWVGSCIGGLYQCDINGNIVKRFFHEPNNPNSLIHDHISDIKTDKNNFIWVGTDNSGLDRFDIETGTFKHYRHDPQNPSSLVNDNIMCLYVDEDNNVWIGTNAGISLYDRKNDNFINYTDSIGFKNVFIVGIIKHSKNFLWISTQGGLYKLDLTNRNLVTFDESYGLQGNEFNRRSYYQTNAGLMLFGGSTGFSMFNPDSIRIPEPELSHYLTGFYLHNIPSVQAGIDIHPNELKQISLKHRQNYFTFDFVAIAYSLSDKIDYSYKLSGFDSDWVVAGKKHSATYTNLPPGKYEFWVQSKFNQNLYKPEKLIVIAIMPPFWKRPLFIFLMAVLLILALFAYIKYRERRLILAKHKLELLVAERTESIEKQKSELESLNKTKDKLFSIIAHDLRNPFNVLLGFTELMYNRIGKWDNKKIAETIGLINASAQRIYTLLENLLAWAKSQNTSFRYKPTMVKLLPLVKDNIALFSTLTETKKISVECDIENNFEVYADIDMLNTIVRNLLSNAIKFSDNEGQISIIAYQKPGNCFIEVSDKGVGIPDDKASLIFSNAFESTAGTDNEKGTGLGLFICREFMEKHHGKIYYKSIPGKGTTFYLEFPEA
ncbi:MAG: hypothetical protein JXB34_04695 [Bacteroidales bacterium]|nr:hypothetical protein [Bacteroidales bacterium]